MSEIAFYEDTKEILLATTFTFLESPYDINIYEIESYQNFANAKRLMNSIIIDFDCATKADFDRYFWNYKEIAENLVKSDEQEWLLSQVQRKEEEKLITVPFKLFYLLTEFHKFKTTFDSFKIETIYNEFDIENDFVTKYLNHIDTLSKKRAQVIFRWTIEDHIMFEDQEDFLYIKDLLTTLSTDDDFPFFTDKNVLLWTIVKVLHTEDRKAINSIFSKLGFQTLKKGVYIIKQIFEDKHNLLDFLIIFNLFFWRHYSFCFSQDYDNRLVWLWQWVRICDSEFVWEYVTWNLYWWTIMTQNFDYAEILKSEKWTSGAEILQYIEEFREEVISKKCSIHDSLKKATKYMAECLENFSKVEFYLSTNNKSIDSVNVIATEKDPQKFKETKNKMPIPHPESIEKWNGKKPYRVYKGKKKI